MQRNLTFKRVSEDEVVKQSGLVLDFDEIARKGVMSKEEKNIAKWYGIYASRQPGNHMARVVVPGGVVTATQARTIADTAEKYALGRLNITTRQAIQFHWLKVSNLADMMRELGRSYLTTMHGCGDVTRNIAACPLAETCKYRRFNVREHAIRTMKYLGSCSDLNNLPRKFKITFSGCPTGCAQPYINCIGAIAVQKEGKKGPENGFKIIIGGGMGWQPFVGQELFSFVPEYRMLDVARAIALLFRDHGDRFNRAKSRLKFVVYRYGIDKCRDIVLQNLIDEGKTIDDLIHGPLKEVGVPYPSRLSNPDDYKGADGRMTLVVRIPKGELSHLQLRDLAEIAEEYGNQRVYTNNRQNIEIKGIDVKKEFELKERVKALGFETEGHNGMKDIVACVGTTYCPKAVSETRALFDLVYPIVHKEKYKAIQDKVLVNITGCPNSCSPYRITDIGFRGMRIREEQGSAEAYEMLVGGTQTDFGKKLGDFKTSDIPDVMENVLDLFLEKRLPGETLAECTNRIGIDEFVKAVYYEEV